MSLVKQQRLLYLLEKHRGLKEKNGLLFYKPHKKQEWFHSCQAKHRYWRTGNRFGKSDMGAAEDCAFALGARIWLSESDPNYRAGIPQRETKGVIVCEDWDKAREIFTNDGSGNAQGKLMKFLPSESIIDVVTVQNNVQCIKVKNLFGTVSLIYITVVSGYRLNPKKSESSQWDWIHVDEPIPYGMWKALSRGLIDTNGRSWFTCTPISEPWIENFFLTTKQQRKPLPPDQIVVNGDKAICGGSSFDNPYTSREGIASYIDGLDEATIKARTEGVPLNMTGRVYNVHDELMLEEPPKGWQSWDNPPDDVAIHVAIDTHPATEMAALFLAVDKSGFYYVYDCIFEHLTYVELAEQVLARLDGRRVGMLLLEPAAFIENQAYQTSLATDLDSQGLFCTKASKDLSRGIIVVKNALRDRKVFFNSNLGRLTFELSNYTWSQRVSNKVVDKDDHLMECLYRLIIDNPFWIDAPSNNFGPVERRVCI